MELRPYQREAVEAVWRYLRERDGNPCVVLPTAAGKSHIIATICQEAVQRWNGRVLILAHVKELLEQAADKLQRTAPDLPVGIYSAGLKRRDLGYAVTIAGIQSVYEKACDVGPMDLVIVDEAHLIQPGEDEGRYGQFVRDARVINPHLRIIGTTATPFRMRTGPICTPNGILNEICYEVSVRELIVQGYLCPLRTKAGTQRPDYDQLHVRGGEFVADEVEALMDDDALVGSACREIVEHTQNRKSVLIFASGVQHGQHIVRVLEQSNKADCGFVCGETPPSDRSAILRRFREGALKYLCNVNVLTTGFDAPNIDCVALVRPTLSPGLYYQMCLDMETEVLTPQGWARCEQVREGDPIGAYDLASGHIEWCAAGEKVHRPMAPGERMYAISAPHLDVRVTHLHTMIYRGHAASCKRWRQRTAESLAHVRDSYLIPVAGTGDGPGVPLSDDELRFLGWALTDGYRNPHNNTVIICQSSRSPWLNAIRAMLDGCGFGYRVYRHRRSGRQAGYPDGLQFVVPYGKPRGTNRGLEGWSRLADYLNRPILESLADASRAQLRVLLAAMNLGDGVKRTAISWQARTTTLCLGEHKFLADQLQALCIRRGFRCNISSARQRTSWHKGDPKAQYLLHIREQTEATVGGATLRPSRLVRRRSRIEETASRPDEWVWCLRTRLGTLVTRRNGKVAIVGNCGRGFRLHPGKNDCLVLDFGSNILRHGPVDQLRLNKAGGNGDGPAPAKECPQCHAVIAAGYGICPDCGYEFPPPERSKHDGVAGSEAILSDQVTRTDYNVSEVFYAVHTKRDAPPEAPRTMRVEYKVGWQHYVSEWVCFEHEGYARRKAEAWWRVRSDEPVPGDSEEAVELAHAGALAPALAITVERKGGDKFDRVVSHHLGPKPSRLESEEDLPEYVPCHDEDVPF